MTRRVGPTSFVLLTVIAVLGSLLSTSCDSRLNSSPACAAGRGLCYELPVNAGALINTENFDGGPELSEDGLTLLYGSARLNGLGQLDEDIYIATRETTAQPFGPARNLGPSINSIGFGDYSPDLSIDGLTLYFSSSRPGGLGEADLYVTTRESIDDPWPPQNLGANVNTPSFEGQPSISANGTTLYWDSERPDGLGDFDIWMSTRENAGRDFGPAVNVGPEVNTIGPEFGAAISQDERQLFFSSARTANAGKMDIWVVERETTSHSWSTPINLDTLNSPSFQAMPTFSRHGREVCFMALRPEGFGGLDVWCANRAQ